LRGGDLQVAAQANVQIDAEIGKKDHFWIGNQLSTILKSVLSGLPASIRLRQGEAGNRICWSFRLPIGMTAARFGGNVGATCRHYLYLHIDDFFGPEPAGWSELFLDENPFRNFLSLWGEGAAFSSQVARLGENQPSFLFAHTIQPLTDISKERSHSCQSTKSWTC